MSKPGFVVKELPSWTEFVQTLLLQDDGAPGGESPFIYRGQADAAWNIRTTLDRDRSFTSDEERGQYASRLLADFRRQAIGLEHFSQRESPEGDALELLARHHGLPSVILDWTSSPFVAAFFAFEESLTAKADHISVYALPLAWMMPEEVSGNEIDLIDSPELLWPNVRAVEQRSVFMRVKTLKPLEDLLYGFKLLLPTNEARTALRSLSKMGIDARSLFRDLDGAARCVRDRARIGLSGEGVL